MWLWPPLATRDHRSTNFTKSPYVYDFDRQSLCYVHQSPCNSDYFNKIKFLQFDPCISQKFARMGYVTNLKKLIHQKLVWLWSPVFMWLKLFQSSNESANSTMTSPLFIQIKTTRTGIFHQVYLLRQTVRFVSFLILWDNIIIFSCRLYLRNYRLI